MRLDKIVWILLVSLFLTNCTATRSNVGGFRCDHNNVCVEMGVNRSLCDCCDPTLVTDPFVNREIMYNSDYDIHNATFVDHLNHSPNGSSYTNWFNQKTGNSGIIHTTRSYNKGSY